MHLITGNSHLIWALKTVKQKRNGPRSVSNYGVNGTTFS